MATESMGENTSSRPGLFFWLLLLVTFGAVVGFSWSGHDYVTAGAAAIVGLCGLCGYLVGGIRLIGFVGSLVAVYKYSGTVSPWVTPGLNKVVTIAPGFSALASLAVATVLIVLVVTLVAAFASRWATSTRPQIAALNRLFGFGLGTVEGAVIVYVMLCGVMATAPLAENRLKFAASEQPVDPFANNVAQHVVDISNQARQSSLAPLVTGYNPFESAPQWIGLQRTASIVGDPGTFTRLADHPAIARLQDAPAVRAAVESLAADPELRALSRSGKKLDRDTAMALLKNPQVAKLFEQPELIQEILRTVGELDASVWDRELTANSP